MPTRCRDHGLRRQSRTNESVNCRRKKESSPWRAAWIRWGKASPKNNTEVLIRRSRGCRRRHADRRGRNDGPGDRVVTLTRQQCTSTGTAWQSTVRGHWRSSSPGACGRGPRAEVCCLPCELVGVERNDSRCDGKRTTTAGVEYELS